MMLGASYPHLRLEASLAPAMARASMAPPPALRSMEARLRATTAWAATMGLACTARSLAASARCWRRPASCPSLLLWRRCLRWAAALRRQWHLASHGTTRCRWTSRGAHYRRDTTMQQQLLGLRAWQPMRSRRCRPPRLLSRHHPCQQQRWTRRWHRTASASAVRVTSAAQHRGHLS